MAMRHLPELDMIQAFLAVAEALSFRRAAARLNLDQSAISRRVKELERRLGTDLLARTTRDVRLTAAGEVFFEENRDLVRRLERGAEAALRAAQGERGRLRLGYMSFAAHGPLPRTVEAFRTRYPKVGVEPVYMGTQAQQQALRRGTLDLGFLIGPFAEDGFGTLTMADEKLVALLPASHPLARRRGLLLADLAAECLVLGNAAEWDFYRALLGGLFASRGLPLAPGLEPSSTMGILGLVAGGLGVTLLPAGIRALRPQGLVIREILDCEMSIRTVLVWRLSAGPAVQNFVAAARPLALAGGAALP
jgi:DNA-binding transcriptional LysR family regulator